MVLGIFSKAIEVPCSKLQGMRFVHRAAIFEVQGGKEARFPWRSQCTFDAEWASRGGYDVPIRIAP